ncbi:tRNA (adenosine(37)-N6)-threonylcarbamoyltransferase complex ATPase subunit type 1 TsaE [soil metagenome]
MAPVAITLATRRATTSLGKKIAAKLVPGDLVVLSGDLGAGKTFLTRAIARGLGVDTEERIASPTFALVIEHALPKEGVLLHVDLHRLRDDPKLDFALEVSRLGLRERRREGAIVICEWGEGTAPILGLPELVVRLAAKGSTTREAILEGPRALGLA